MSEEFHDQFRRQFEHSHFRNLESIGQHDFEDRSHVRTPVGFDDNANAIAKRNLIINREFCSFLQSKRQNQVIKSFKLTTGLPALRRSP